MVTLFVTMNPQRLCSRWVNSGLAGRFEVFLSANRALGVSFALALALSGCRDDSQISTDLAITDTPQLDPIVPQVNQAVLLTAVVRNREGNYASASEVAIRVDGTEVLRVQVDAIAPDSSRSLSVSLTFSTVGTHSVALIADPDGRLNDSDRSNNTFIMTVTVTLPVSG